VVLVRVGHAKVEEEMSEQAIPSGLICLRVLQQDGK
jgi:hypothetical protein